MGLGRLAVVMVFSVLATACVDDGLDPGSNAAVSVENEYGLTLAIARASQIEELREYLERGADVATPFWWVAIAVPNTYREQLYAAGGVMASLADQDGFVVMQSYNDVCDPRLPSSEQCWLRESYVGGDIGLSGSLQLHLSQDMATGLVSVQWDGVGDGSPLASRPRSWSVSLEAPF